MIVRVRFIVLHNNIWFIPLKLITIMYNIIDRYLNILNDILKLIDMY